MFLNRILCISLWLTLATAVFAQSKLDSTQILKEIVVVGDHYREVIPSQRLSREKLEALSSFSVADAIRYFSGVQIKDYGGIGGLKTVDIRSMGTNHLGVFYDGIQLGNAQNGQIDLGKFSLDNIEEISLYNGQKSEIFQSAKDFGSAGTVYLRTRRPRFTGNKKYNLVSYFRTGSFGLVNPSVLWEQKISKNISSSLNTEYIYSSGEYPFRYRKTQNGVVMWDTTAIRQNGDINSLRLEESINGSLQDGYWRVKTYFYNSEKGIPGPIVNNDWKRPERQWDRNFFLQGTFQKKMFKNDELLLNVKYANDWLRYYSYNAIPWDSVTSTTKSRYANNRFTQQEIYTSIVNKYSILPNWEINFSADYQWNTLDSYLSLGKGKLTYANRHTMLVALATAFEWKRLKAQASMLGTFVRDDADIRQLDTIPNKIASQTYLNTDKQEYTPAIFLSYKPFKYHDLNFRAFYKRIFRMPTLNDLFYADIANVKLNPEHTTQYNIGFQYVAETWHAASLQIRADAYYNEVIDKIIAIPTAGGQYRWMMINIGLVEIRGVDVSAQIGWKLPASIQLNTSLNYTYQKAQDFTRSGKPALDKWRGGQIPYIPWHSGSVIANLVWRSWDLNYSFIYVGERYTRSANIPINHVQPWYTHDLTMGKAFHLPLIPSKRGGTPPTSEGAGGRLKLSAEINNLFNQQFEVVDCYPMPGTNFKIILKLEI